jgi:hypothetical protein
MNNAPDAKSDSSVICISSSASRTATVNVIANDTDAEDNTIYLTSAEFINATDAALADVTVNAADSTVILTVKPDVYLGVAGHDFRILYHVRDNGIPASQCATGVLKVTVYHTPNYPDIRIRICPDAGSVDLSKYLDTINGVKTNEIKWTSQLPSVLIASPAGTISTSNLSSAKVHTFTYTVNSLCVNDQTRKVYLEVLKNDKFSILRDTVVMCYLYAEAIHLNQLFGIEADGDWDYPPAIKPYISKTSYGGTIMNGRKIYDDNLLTVFDKNYHGITARIIELKYKTKNNSCLHGETYRIRIVLTPDLTK